MPKNKIVLAIKKNADSKLPCLSSWARFLLIEAVVCPFSSLKANFGDGRRLVYGDESTCSAWAEGFQWAPGVLDPAKDLLPVEIDFKYRWGCWYMARS